MNIQDSVTTCMKKYIDFSGRASRSEYWWFILFCFIAQLISSMIDKNNILLAIVGLVLFLPSLAVLARRLHDIDRTAWWMLILLIPLIGPLVILIFAVTQGSEGPNRFGPPPL